MADLLILDAMVRGVAVGGFATTAAVLAVSRAPAPLRWLGAAFLLSACGHAVDNCLALMRHGHASEISRALSVAGPGLFWAFALTLFEDAPRIPAPRLAIPAAMLAWALIAASQSYGWPARLLWTAFNLASILLVGHALFAIWRGWRGDLVEPRRRLRAPVMAAAATYVLVTAGLDLVNNLGLGLIYMPLLQAFVLAALALAGALALLRMDPVLVGIATSGPRAPPVPAAEAIRMAEAGLEPGDAAIMARLDRAMGEEEIWRREELSVRALADHVGAPEHRLRRLINGVLGHRNFAAFVNARRIAAAQQALCDPAQARRPVSAIAYDLGFGSLGPFNRAFKDATGLTPTAWRQARAG